MTTASTRPGWAAPAAIIATIFGVATVLSGGRALFGDAEARATLGAIVPFVLWFNFLAGFAYIVAGAGLVLWKRWAAQLSAAIAIATMIIFIAFGIHLAAGGAFEIRTVGAMALRTGVWAVLALLAHRAMSKIQDPPA